VYKEHTVQYTA